MELYSSKFELISHSHLLLNGSEFMHLRNLCNVAGRCHLKISYHSTYFT